MPHNPFPRVVYPARKRDPLPLPPMEPHGNSPALVIAFVVGLMVLGGIAALGMAALSCARAVIQ